MTATLGTPKSGNAPERKTDFTKKHETHPRESKDGWTIAEVTLTGEGNGTDEMKISFQIECSLARLNARLMAIVPDLIIVLDRETGEAITKSLRYGQRIKVLDVAAPDVTRSEAAMEIIGPRAFDRRRFRTAGGLGHCAFHLKRIGSTRRFVHRTGFSCAVCRLRAASARDEQSRRLEAMANHRNSKPEQVRVVSTAPEVLEMIAVMVGTGALMPTVRRWKLQFMENCVAGIIRDKTRKPGMPPARHRAERTRAIRTPNRTPETALA